jgi:hypothetical protein
MKGRLFVAVILVCAALVFVFGGALAFEFTYSSGFQVQNLAASPADIVLTFYNQDGTVAGPVLNASIPANGSVTYFPLSNVPDGFNGSVVISSNQALAAITNVIGDSFAAAAAYEGFDQGNTSLLLPLLMNNNAGYNTWFNVQNTGSSDANVTVEYSDGAPDATAIIKPGASHTFDQTAEGHAAGAVFSGVVTSDQPVAASVIEENASIMFAYSGFVGGSEFPVLPLINANNAGYVTGVQIQNGGASSTDVTVSYTPSTAGTPCEETQTIPAGESKTFALLAFNSGANSDCAPLALFVGSGAVTVNSASQPLVAIVNQLGAANGEAYSGYDVDTATTASVMPLIMDSNGGFFTGFNVMNVGGGSTTVTCTFTDTSYTVSDTLAAGEALTALQEDQIDPSGYVGSGTCTSTGEPIVSVVNELGASPTADQLLVYNGINP